MCTDEGHYAADAEERVVRLQQLHRLCQLLSLEELQQLNQAMEAASNVDERKSLFLEKAKALEERLEREKAEQLGGAQSGRSQGGGDKGSSASSSSSWSADDVQLLVKAVNLFPAGTANRWEVVAAFLNQHGATSDRTAKEVLAKAKSLQKLDPQLKEEANRKAYEQHQKSLGAKAEVAFKDESTPSQRFDGDGGAVVWQAEEQRLLEQALKTYPASTPDRWDRIAECVPTRSKKECMRRYKDLVELVKTKKAAQQAAAAAAAQSGRK